MCSSEPRAQRRRRESGESVYSRSGFRSLAGWPTRVATFFGITVAGAIILARRSKRCRGGGGKKSITRMKWIALLNVLKSHSLQVSRGRILFLCAARPVNTGGSFPARFRFLTQRARCRVGLVLTPILLS